MKEWYCFDNLDKVFDMEPRGAGVLIEYDESTLPGTHSYGPEISKALKGRKCTWGDKISESRKGKPTGRKMSDEQKKRMSQARWKGHTNLTKEQKLERQRIYEHKKYNLNKKKERASKENK